MTTVLEDLAMAEDLLLQNQSSLAWGAIHFIRHAREQLVREALHEILPVTEVPHDG